MKNLKKHTKALAIIGGISALVIVLVLLVLGSSGSSIFQNENDVAKIQATKGDGVLIVGQDGKVEYRKGDTIYTDFWSSDRTKAFFDYYDEVYSGSAQKDGSTASFTYDDDELLDTITDQTENGNNGGSGNGGDDDDVSEYFNTPGASATPSGTFVSTPTPNPQGQPWCLYWRLSYCVILYTPSPTGTPNPNEEGILPPNCEDNQFTGKTVIGQELCVPPIEE